MSRTTFTLWRGSQIVHGLVFDLAHSSEETARKRILALWSRGSKLYRLPGWLVLIFSEPRRQQCSAVPGLPLIQVGVHLSAVRIEPGDPELCDTSGSRLVLAEGGRLRFLELLDECQENPATWLDLSAFSRTEVKPLGAPPAPPVPRIIAAEKQTHELLAQPGLKPSAERKSFLSEIGKKTSADAESRRSGVEFGDVILAPLFGVFRLLSRLASPLPGETAAGRPEYGTGTSSGRSGPPPVPRPPGLLQRAWSRVAWFAYVRLVGGRFAGRQARYLRKTMKMFERGDIGEALRHAVPLAGAREVLDQLQLPAFRLPGPRAGLDIRTGLSPAARSVLISGNPYEQMDLYAYLKQLYQQAFETLDRQGKRAEAAFVLAELLQDTEAAVSYLERNGMLRLAAELAEGRKARPGLVVRQWFLAGDIGRAIRIARMTGSFSEAVKLLEPSHPDEARKLRPLWAELLADGGDYAGAVDSIWGMELPSARIRDHWLELAIAQGGESGARMLVRKVSAQPESYEACLEPIRALLASRDTEEMPLKRAFADALVSEKKTPQLSRIAGLTYRSLLRDLGDGTVRSADSSTQRIYRVLAFAENRALSADLPQLSSPRPAGGDVPDLRKREIPLVLEFADHGTTPVCDAVALPKRRLLLALGEAGAAVVNQDGRTLFRFAAPAHHLVISHAGNRALCIAQRGDHQRLAQLDLDRRTVRELGDARLGQWAPEYDGMTWYAEQGGQIFAFDMQSGDLEVLDQTPKLGPCRVGWSRSAIGVAAIAQDSSLKYFRFDLPSLSTAKEQSFRHSPEDRSYLALRHDGYLLTLHEVIDEVRGPELELSQMDLHALPFSRRLGDFGRPLSPVVGESWIAIPVLLGDDLSISLLEDSPRFENRVRARLILKGASRARLRIDQDRLLLADSTGRVIGIDLTDGALAVTAKLRM